MDADLSAIFAPHLAADEMLTDSAAIAPLLLDERGRYHGQAQMVLQPRTTAAVQTIVRLCNQHRIALTPQGGNTGLCGAATPQGGVLLLLHRLNRIREVSPADGSITVEAGAVLQTVQAAASAAGWLFPLSLASEGSCQIGGNLACNAGGINVLRYGTVRDLVLGLEVVLPDGTLLSHLTPLHKNTTGFDLKNLFIGSEGTLGVITAATLKLFPSAQSAATLWAACADIAACVRLLALLRRTCGERIRSFELLSVAALQVSLADLGAHTPLNTVSPWQILCELDDTAADQGWAELLPEALCAAGFDDTLLAQNETQRAAWWRIREQVSAAQKRRGVSIKHDIALPITRVADFVAACAKRIEAEFPQAEIVLFGHLGDGSLHYNVFLPDYPDERAYAYEEHINTLVYECVLDHGGTIAAEHGIGVLKKHWLPKVRSEAELALMRTIKHALDPHGIMNPGKVLPD